MVFWWGWNYDALQISIRDSLLKGQMFKNSRIDEGSGLDWKCTGVVRVCKSLLRISFLSSVRCWSRWFRFCSGFFPRLLKRSKVAVLNHSTPATSCEPVDLLTCNLPFLHGFLPETFHQQHSACVWIDGIHLQEAGVNVHGFFLQAVLKCVANWCQLAGLSWLLQSCSRVWCFVVSREWKNMYIYIYHPHAFFNY